jgi:hypothetical protein
VENEAGGGGCRVEKERVMDMCVYLESRNGHFFNMYFMAFGLDDSILDELLHTKRQSIDHLFHFKIGVLYLVCLIIGYVFLDFIFTRRGIIMS